MDATVIRTVMNSFGPFKMYSFVHELGHEDEEGYPFSPNFQMSLVQPIPLGWHFRKLFQRLLLVHVSRESVSEGLARRFGAHTQTDHACSYFSISVLRIFLDSPHFFCRNDSSSNLAQSLPAGLNFCSKRTCVSSGIQFTRHFIEFVVVEMKQIVSSNSNVILTRQTNGQRSGIWLQ